MKIYKKGALRVFSGKCCKCDAGIPAGAKSTWGDPIEIHTGDIIILWRGNFLGTDIEEWTPSGLTAVVADHYKSYSDGSVELTGGGTPYPMGIKSCGFDHPEWRVQVVKKYHDVVPGERWPEFGFSYQFSPEADKAIMEAGK